MDKVRTAGVLMLLGHLVAGFLGLYGYLEAGVEFNSLMIIPLFIWICFALGFYNLSIARIDEIENVKGSDNGLNEGEVSNNEKKFRLFLIVIAIVIVSLVVLLVI